MKSESDIVIIGAGIWGLSTAYHLADSAGGMPAHVHAQCRTCHRVIDLPDDVLDDVRRRLDASAGFRLDPHHVALSGLCRDCVEAAVEDR